MDVCIAGGPAVKTAVKRGAIAGLGDVSTVREKNSALLPPSTKKSAVSPVTAEHVNKHVN